MGLPHQDCCHHRPGRCCTAVRAGHHWRRALLESSSSSGDLQHICCMISWQDGARHDPVAMTLQCICTGMHEHVHVSLGEFEQAMRTEVDRRTASNPLLAATLDRSLTVLSSKPLPLGCEFGVHAPDSMLASGEPLTSSWWLCRSNTTTCAKTFCGPVSNPGID
jgi:hypothetical protein